MTENISDAGTTAHQDLDDRVHSSDSGSGPNEPLFGSIGASESALPVETTILVGIPAYNEARSIADIVAKARTYADDVVVVDDGSTDDTAARARAAGATVIVHDRNRGYGATLETIFRHARTMNAEHLVTMDGDGQHDAGDIPKLVAVQQASGAELVVGSRFVGGSNARMPRYRRFGLAVVNGLTNACMRARYSSPAVADTQSGFRAYNADAIEAILQSGGIGSGMEASLDLLFKAAREGFTMMEVPTTVAYDVDSPSSQNPATHGLALLGTILGEMLQVPTGRVAGLAAGVAVAFGMALVLSGTPGGVDPGVVFVVLVGIAAGVGMAFPDVIPWLGRLKDR